MRSRSRARAGSVLVEALIALVVLASAGTGLITLLGQTAHTIRVTRESERATRGASAELNRLVLLDRDALLSLVGRHGSHGWTIDITAATATLFDVRIAASDTGASLLHTRVYRPVSDSSDAPR